MRLFAAAAMFLPALAGATGNGVPQSGYPSWEERTVMVYVNRARADPAADLAGCAPSTCADYQCYTASPPMVWDYNLNRSARFHSTNLAATGSQLQHDSPCTLVTNISSLFPPEGTCDGSASCACQPNTLFTCSPSANPSPPNPTCTSPWERIGDFGGSGQGENAAAGYSDPQSTFYEWLWEGDSDSTCGWRYTNGHRANILGGASSLGVGYSQAHWTQDFGGGYPQFELVAGSHEPQQGGGAVDFRANWYDGTGNQPAQDAQVDVDGSCSPMTVERGSAGNATYHAQVSVASGCHRYLFVFKDAAGQTQVLPEQGSYGIGDPASCPDWDASAPTLCDGTTGSTSGTTSTSTSTTTSSTSSTTTSSSTTTTSSGGTTSGTTGASTTSTSGGTTSAAVSSTSTSSTTSSATSTTGGASTSSTSSTSSAAASSGGAGDVAGAVNGSCASVSGLDLLALLAAAALFSRACRPVRRSW